MSIEHGRVLSKEVAERLLQQAGTQVKVICFCFFNVFSKPFCIVAQFGHGVFSKNTFCHSNNVCPSLFSL